MVYGHEPFEEIDLKNKDPKELDRRFQAMEFPELNRHEVFDGLISASWYNVYPTMALLAYDCRHKTKDPVSEAKYESVDFAKERKKCERMVRRGLLGADLAVQFQPGWRRYLNAFAKKGIFLWQSLANLLRRFWAWS